MKFPGIIAAAISRLIGSSQQLNLNLLKVHRKLSKKSLQMNLLQEENVNLSAELQGVFSKTFPSWNRQVCS